MNHLNIFLQKITYYVTQLQVKGNRFKEWNAKNRIEKNQLSNAISIKYEATKFPNGYMKREKSRICLIESLRIYLPSNASQTAEISMHQLEGLGCPKLIFFYDMDFRLILR